MVFEENGLTTLSAHHSSASYCDSGSARLLKSNSALDSVTGISTINGVRCETFDYLFNRHSFFGNVSDTVCGLAEQLKSNKDEIKCCF